MPLPMGLTPTIRATLGLVLRESLCVRGTPCEERCAGFAGCLFDRLYGVDEQSGSRELVIKPLRRVGTGFRAGQEFAFDLVVLGALRDETRNLVDAMVEVGKRGLGPARTPFVVLRANLTALEDRPVSILFEGEALKVDHLEEMAWIPRPLPRVETLRLEFPQAIDLRQRGLDEVRINCESLVRAALRRLTGTYKRFGCPRVDWRFDEILDRARSVSTVLDDTHVTQALRWSSRQGRKVPVGGVAGTLVFHGEALLDLVGLIQAAAFLHVGHGTMQGLGGFSVFAEE